MRGRLTNLPPEVLTVVFSHLRPRALRQCLLVNSAFNTLVRPQLFRFVVASGEGNTLAFPLVKDVAGEQEPDAPRPTPSDLSQLILHWHKRCPFSVPCGVPEVSSCRVLKVHLASPDDKESIASVHSDDLGHGGGAHSQQQNPILPYLQCHILHHALQSASVDKLVLHDVPVAYGNVDPELLPPSLSETIKEAVLVLNVDSMNEHNETLIHIFHCKYALIEDEDDPICAFLGSDNNELLLHPADGSLDSALPPNVEELAFVFWAPNPDTDVAPSCCTSHAPCSDCGEEVEGEEEEESAASYWPFRTGEQANCWQDKFWRDLAAAVAPKLLHQLRSLTIVNASGIIPPGVARAPHLRAISTGAATHAKYETEFREILSKCLSSEHGVAGDKVQGYVDRVHFKYMQEWLLATEWEDVFSWSEVKPWLEFKRPALITDYFKPHNPNAVQWRKDMDAIERISLRHRRSTMKRTKPNKYTWRK